jgi:hypothetical protein
VSGGRPGVCWTLDVGRWRLAESGRSAFRRLRSLNALVFRLTVHWLFVFETEYEHPMNARLTRSTLSRCTNRHLRPNA